MSDFETLAYTAYEWECQGCDDTNTVDHDPSGEELVCYLCSKTSRITDVR